MAFTTQYNSNRWMGLIGQGLSCVANGNYRGGLGVFGSICGNFGMGSGIGQLLGGYGDFVSSGSYGNNIGALLCGGGSGLYGMGGLNSLFYDPFGRPNYDNMAIAGVASAVVSIGLQAYQSQRTQKAEVKVVAENNISAKEKRIKEIDEILKDDTKLEALVDSSLKTTVTERKTAKTTQEAIANQANTDYTTNSTNLENAKVEKSAIEAKGENATEADKKRLETLSGGKDVVGSIEYYTAKVNEALETQNNANAEIAKLDGEGQGSIKEAETALETAKRAKKAELESEKAELEAELVSAKTEYYQNLLPKGSAKKDVDALLNADNFVKDDVEKVTKKDFAGAYKCFAQSTNSDEKLKYAKVVNAFFNKLPAGEKDSNITGANKIAEDYIKMKEKATSAE